MSNQSLIELSKRREAFADNELGFNAWLTICEIAERQHAAPGQDVVERVARAIVKAQGLPEDEICCCDEQAIIRKPRWQWFEEEAKAAIAAMGDASTRKDEGNITSAATGADSPTTTSTLIERILNPRLWAQEMRDAWHNNIPNTQAAFDALREIALKGTAA